MNYRKLKITDRDFVISLLVVTVLSASACNYYLFGQTWQSLLEKMFDNGDSGSNGVNLTLRDLLQQHGEQELVHVGNTVRAAGRAIARGRKAVSRGTSWHQKDLLRII